MDIQPKKFTAAGEAILQISKLLGIFDEFSNEEKFNYLNSKVDGDIISQAITKRQIAKKEKNYKEADRIRKYLLEEYGVTLEDHADGESTWRKA